MGCRDGDAASACGYRSGAGQARPGGGHNLGLLSGCLMTAPIPFLLSAFGKPWARRAGTAQLTGRISPFPLTALSAALPWAAALRLRAANCSRLRWFCCIWLLIETFHSSLEPPVAVKSAETDPLKPRSPVAAELSCWRGQQEGVRAGTREEGLTGRLHRGQAGSAPIVRKVGVLL